MTILLATGSSFQTTAWPCVFLFDGDQGSRKINVCCAVPFKFTNGKLLGTKLVATYDTPIHEDLSLIYYLFHTFIYYFPALRDLLTHHRFLKIDHFTVVGFNLYPRLGMSVRLRIQTSIVFLFGGLKYTS